MKKIRTLKVNEENMYCLYEAVEQLVFALSELKIEHSPPVQSKVSIALHNANKLLNDCKMPITLENQRDNRD